MSFKHLLCIGLLCFSLLAGCAYGDHLKRGDQLAEQGKLEDALTEYEAALTLKPDSEEAQERVASTHAAIAKRDAQQARDLLAQGDFHGAVKAASSARYHAEGDPSFAPLVDEIYAGTAAEADRLAEQLQWAASLSLLNLLYDELPDHRSQTETRLQTLSQRWGADLASRAARAEAAKHHGDALLLYARASSLLKTPDVIAKRDELAAMMLDLHYYGVSIKALDNAQGSTAATSQLATLNLPEHVLLIDERAAKKGKKPHITIKLAVGRTDFTHDRSSSFRSARYKSGTRQVPNPFYQSAQDDVARAQREVDRYQDEVYRLERDLSNYESQVAREGPTPGVSTSAKQGVSRTRSSLDNARNNLQRAHSDLARQRERAMRVSPTTEEDVYSELQYTVTEHTLTATAPLQLTLEFSDGREPKKLNVNVSSVATDQEHAPQPLANIPGDPLNLPSQSYMNRNVWTRASAVAHSKLVESLDEHRLSLMDRAFASGEDGLRVHYLVLYILLDPSSVDPKVVKELYELRGIPDAPEVLFSF